jgi:dihydrofolate reductase
VVTHRQQEDLVRGPTTFSFVPGLEEALNRAAAVAGDKAVMVVGGASLVRQCLDAGLVDELRLHIAPVLLGAGRTVYDGDERLQHSLELIDAKATPLALHVRYRVLRDG